MCPSPLLFLQIRGLRIRSPTAIVRQHHSQAVPDAIRLAFGIRNRTSPSPLPGQRDEMAAFAAALLPSRVGDDPMECEYDAERRRLRMVAQSCYLPRHAEDAYFIHAGVVGVADGVGGYRSDGVDASAFSAPGGHAQRLHGGGVGAARRARVPARAA
ncbi:hypothetical protein PR202_ga02083 [Eleusine coracana subsp. coracana]|uniref:Protein-serine/threonine phosphatase n=1 Tax=Eleusine coracana subsp. coracana TaxID=191504 RepID=A0AAV5BIU8_ELECO|nr:hypothetical protein PR202_ga01396 [Eleusine coracana subsp. coracana]GJM86242.1 hypothetical protein PR202_ga02083 [Eleusine coracana subsp. coracana]